MPLSTLPIELVRHVGLLLLPEEPYHTYPDSFYSTDFIENNRTLRALTYSCRSTRTILEPLLFRFILMTDAADITHFFLLLAQNPRLRPYVRHVACVSALDWDHLSGWSACRRMWMWRYGLGMGFKDVMVDAGFDLDYGNISKIFEEIDCDTDHSFPVDEPVKLMFGSVLIMTPEVETLFFHHRLSRQDFNPSNILGGILNEAVNGKGYVVMPKLRVMELGTQEDEPLGDAIELFFDEPDMWMNLRTLILDDSDFDDQFFQLLVERSFGSELPVEELYVRGKVTGLLATPTDSVDGAPDEFDRDTSFEHILDVLERDFQPDNDVFCNLRLLDVDFPPHPKRARIGSRVLKLFLTAIGGAPETLRLTRHPFPTEALSTAVQTCLKVLVVKECTDMPEVPSAYQMTKAVATLFHEGQFCVPELDWVHVNESRKEMGS
ncbi:hypothetical protein EDB80DRAFT_716797 [Ilyonectria destructans]|nr:hypothetical protein EDB80DRAFT_716797 [Ilyonectria destructans]